MLETDARCRLLAAVEARPGASVTALARAVGQSPSTVAYHLLLLDAAGLVRRVRDGRQVRCYTPAQFHDPGVRFAALLGRPRTVALLRRLETDPHEGPAALARGLGVRVPTVMWHLGKLEATGMVRVVHEGRRVQVRVDPRLFAILDAVPGYAPEVHAASSGSAP